MKRAAVTSALLLIGAAIVHAGPNRYGHSDRVERHMLPSVTTGPSDPAWSPDGRWIAFSMRGDIWKVPAEGGVAVALTKGPSYHFEPAWSPDGQRLALTVDVNGNLDIATVSANGGEVTRVSPHRQVDVEPVWSRDGASIYFVSARAGGFRIFRHDLASARDTQVVAGFQPSISPDGKALAYVAAVQGKLGTGGLWVKELPNGEPRLVHYEETEYRARPVWTPDAQSLLYVSDEMGSNDVAQIQIAGGNPIVLTADARDEYSPTPSPDGQRFAFMSNRSGPMVLYTSALGGGPVSSWAPVALRELRRATATGRVRARVLGPDGKPMPAKIMVVASDGRGYTPAGGFHRVSAATETHYFHTVGDFDLDLPAGEATIEAQRGFEYKPVLIKLNVLAGQVHTPVLRLERLIDLPAQGWYSGDTHVHDLHQGNFGLTHGTMFDQVLAEDLHVANLLIHMDGTRLMGRWGDLTGRPHPLSTPTHIMQYGEEFRGGLGHIGMIGISKYILPFTAGSANTPYAQHTLDFAYLDGARAQGGLAGFMHPYLNRVDTPQAGAGSLIPVNVALRKGDFYDVSTLYSDEIASAEMYYRFLNCGFRIPATGGSDNFSDVYRDPPPGSDRTFVRVTGALTLQSWMEGIRKQRTFSSTGPILLLTVNGRNIGDSLSVAGPYKVMAEATSIAPLDSLQIIANGKVVKNVVGTHPGRIAFSGDINLPEGGWIAARVVGPPSKYIGDSYAFAQTTPVYIGNRFVSREDGRFLADVVSAIATRTERSRWRSEAERTHFRNALDQARAVYERCARGERP